LDQGELSILSPKPQVSGFEIQIKNPAP